MLLHSKLLASAVHHLQSVFTACGVGAMSAISGGVENNTYTQHTSRQHDHCVQCRGFTLGPPSATSVRGEKSACTTCPLQAFRCAQVATEEQATNEQRAERYTETEPQREQATEQGSSQTATRRRHLHTTTTHPSHQQHHCHSALCLVHTFCVYTSPQLLHRSSAHLPTQRSAGTSTTSTGSAPTRRHNLTLLTTEHNHTHTQSPQHITDNPHSHHVWQSSTSWFSQG